MSNKESEIEVVREKSFGSDLWGIIFMAGGFLVLVSLVSSLIDNSKNILGPVLGTYLSTGLVFLFGWIPVFAFPLSILFSGVLLFRGLHLPVKRLLYVLAISLQVSVLLAIHNLPIIADVERIDSNIFGNLIVRLLHFIFGIYTFGPYFLFSLTLFITIILMFELDLRALVDSISSFVKAKLAVMREESEKKKSEKAQKSEDKKVEKEKKAAEKAALKAEKTIVKNDEDESFEPASKKEKSSVKEMQKEHLEEQMDEFEQKNNDPITIQTYDDETVVEDDIDEEDESLENVGEADISEGAGLIELGAASEEELTSDLEPPKKPSKPYVVPEMDIIPDPPPVVNNLDREEIEANSELLQKTLMNFGVKGKVVSVSPGPVVTQYEIELAPGIKISKVVNLQDDISLAVGGKKIRIEAPIPGKAAVGIELPNSDMQVVHFKSILSSPKFQNTKMNIPVIIGKSISGKPFFTDVQKMPHILIAGQTGAGKSVGINSIICSMLMTKKPEELRLILIDPKKVEMAYFKGIPHLLSPVVTEAKEAVEALRWAVKEMERRYRLLAKIPARNIDSFNTKVEEGSIKEGVIPEHDNKHMPFIVIVVDELADLMMTASKDVEGLIQRIAQLARAVGIHLIIATQRPSVDIITGPIKANLTSRISFRTIQSTDSRTILGSVGAEKLLGRGDMLFLRNGAPDIERYHGSFISEEDVETIVKSILDQEVETEQISSFEELTGGGSDGGSSGRSSGGGNSGDRDENFEEATRLIVSNGIGSTSLIQRRLKLGYARAGRIMDELCEAGIVGPAQGSKPREVLASMENIEDMFGA